VGANGHNAEVTEV